jgi:hypothetical protein
MLGGASLVGLSGADPGASLLVLMVGRVLGAILDYNHVVLAFGLEPDGFFAKVLTLFTSWC